MVELSRRAMFKAAGAVGAVILPAAGVTGAKSAVAPAVTYLFLNSMEAAFIEAAVARWGRESRRATVFFVARRLS